MVVSLVLSILASIDVPLAIELATKLLGKGLQVDRSGSNDTIPVYITSKKDGGLIIPYAMPPPCFGTWENPIGVGQ